MTIVVAHMRFSEAEHCTQKSELCPQLLFITNTNHKLLGKPSTSRHKDQTLACTFVHLKLLRNLQLYPRNSVLLYYTLFTHSTAISLCVGFVAFCCGENRTGVWCTLRLDVSEMLIGVFDEKLVKDIWYDGTHYCQDFLKEETLGLKLCLSLGRWCGKAWSFGHVSLTSLIITWPEAGQENAWFAHKKSLWNTCW